MIDSLISKGKELFKGRKVKSRGIALTHVAQGYSANQRHESLLMKAEAPDNLTVEVIKSLEQVQLKISMEEFLRRFYGLWYEDAELLTKLLGFETQAEYDASKEDSSEWMKEWNEQHQEYLDEKLSSITLIKKAQAGEELTLPEQYELIKTRKLFEDGCEQFKLDFEASGGAEVPAPSQSAAPAAIVKTAVSTSSDGANTNENPKESTVAETTQVDVTKSAEFIEMQKALAQQTEMLKAMQSQVADAQEIIKAQKQAKREVAVNKAAAMPFVAEDQREAVADAIENPELATIVAVLEKAVAALADKDTALTAKDTEIEEIKKSFGDGAARGAEGDLSAEALGADDAQTRLNAVIEKAVAKAKSTQTA